MPIPGVQFVAGPGGVLNSAQLTFGPVVKGNLLIACALWANSRVLNNVTDPAGNNWQLLGTRDSADGSGAISAAYYCYANAAGALTVSFNLSGTPAFCVTIGAEYPVGTNGVIGGSAPLASTVDYALNSPIPCGPLNNLTAGCLIFLGCIIDTAATVYNPPVGFTVQKTDNNVYAMADSTSQPSGSPNPQWTLTNSQRAFGFGAAFSPFLPTKNITPQVGTIAMPGYSIQPIEEE